MKLSHLLNGEILTGVFFGVVVGMHYHQLDVYRDPLTIIAVLGALMVLATGKVIKLGK